MIKAPQGTQPHEIVIFFKANFMVKGDSSVPPPRKVIPRRFQGQTLFRRKKTAKRRHPSRSGGWGRGAPMALQLEALEIRALLSASLPTGQLVPACNAIGMAITSSPGRAAGAEQTYAPAASNSRTINSQPAAAGSQLGGGVDASISGSSTAAEGSSYVLSLSLSSSITSWDVTWGDGNVETVPGGTASVAHVFVEEGGDDISAVAHTASGDISSNTVPVTVSEPAIAGVAATLTPVAEGQAGATIEIATFTHAGGSEAASHFSATVDWGAGPVAADAVTQDTSGTYHVTAARPVVVEGGSYPVTVVISDNDAPAVTTTVLDTLAVTEPSILGSSVALPTIHEGDASAAVEVATFTHSGGAEPPTDFTVLVNWGLAGHLSDPAVVSRDDVGLYHVTATRPVYAEESGWKTTPRRSSTIRKWSLSRRSVAAQRRWSGSTKGIPPHRSRSRRSPTPTAWKLWGISRRRSIGAKGP